jgi:hypothetical protein
MPPTAGADTAAAAAAGLCLAALLLWSQIDGNISTTSPNSNASLTETSTPPSSTNDRNRPPKIDQDDVNKTYWYGGNDIVKVWETYLRSNSQHRGIRFSTLKPPHTETQLSIFGSQPTSQLTQQIEFATVLVFQENVDNSSKQQLDLYLNHLNSSLTVSGELTQSDMVRRIIEVEVLLKSYRRQR